MVIFSHHLGWRQGTRHLRQHSEACRFKCVPAFEDGRTQLLKDILETRIDFLGFCRENVSPIMRRLLNWDDVVR